MAGERDDWSVLLGVVWAGAVAGLLVKLLWVDAPAWLAALAYVSLGWVGVVVLQFDSTLTQVFEPNRPPTITVPDPDTDNGEEPEEPINEPEFEWDGTQRVNILLLGTDAAPGRDTVLTDVLLVVSVDPVAETAVMISVPRDTGFVPLPDESLFEGGLYPDKVNEIALQAALDLARTTVRRAERRAVALAEADALPESAVIPYLNRLADLLFVMARAADGGFRAVRD